MSLHYTGREYDQVCEQLRRIKEQNKVMKQKLVSRLSNVLKNQDDKENVFLVLDEVIR